MSETHQATLSSEQQLSILDQREARATKSFGSNGASPFEAAREHHDNLVNDNLELIAENRSMVMEITILTDQLERERAEAAVVKQRLEEKSIILGSISADMSTAADSILKVIKKAQEEANKTKNIPEAVTEFAPKSAGQVALAAIDVALKSSDPWKGNS